MRDRRLPTPGDYVEQVLEHLDAVKARDARRANRLFDKVAAMTDRWREELPDQGLERLCSLSDHPDRHVRVKVGWALMELDADRSDALFLQAAREGPGEDLISALMGLRRLRGLGDFAPIPELGDLGAQDPPE